MVFFRTMLSASIVGPALLGLALSTATAADWPQWRGVERDGHAPDTDLLEQWPEGGPQLAWRTGGLGGGYASVAVVGDRVYTMGDHGDAQYVIAIKRKDGSPVWRMKIGPSWDDEYLGPRATPTVDDDRVYALGTEGDLLCLDATSGALRWNRNIAKDFGGTMMKANGSYEWKFSESPLVDGDRLIVTPGSDEVAMVALNKKTGKEIWRTPMPKLGEAGVDGAGYSSAVVSEAGGVRQYVQFVGRGVISVEAETGKFLWGYNRVANKVANIPTPIIDGNRVFVSSGYGTGAALIELSAKEGGVDSKEAYFLPPDTMQNHHGGMILHDGHIYSGTGHNKGFPLAVELQTGKVAWGPIRNAGKGSAAVAFADGHLYFRYQNGIMVLIEATPSEYREKGSFTIPEVKKESWAHPVIVDGMLYLREQDNLFVYDISTPKPKAE